MKKNMGLYDRALRIIAALTIIILYFMHMITGAAAIILLVIAAIFIITSFISFCPMYLPFGINTRRLKSKE